MSLNDYLHAIGTIDAVRVALWLVAGAISLYFSLGSSRIWTSIAMGFLLVFVSEAYFLYPSEYPMISAMHSVVGTIAILTMTHGLQEYYVFSRTLEAGGQRRWVYLAVLGTVAVSVGFLLVNPDPGDSTVRNIRMVENATWTFLAVINIDMIRKIHLQVRDTPVAPGFVAFAVTFALIFLWRGSALYLDVYGWDPAWEHIARDAGITLDLDRYPGRVTIARVTQQTAGILSSVAASGSFLYVLKLMR